MSFERVARGHSQEVVEQTTVSEIDLGCFDLAFSQVGRPRLEDSHHENGLQRIEIAPRRVVRNGEGPSELGTIPDLAMIVSQHRPKTFQRLCRYREPQLRDISFQEGANEILSPIHALSQRSRQIGAGKRAPQPNTVQLVYADFVESQTPQLMISDASGEGL
jgi:hypothetical protein